MSNPRGFLQFSRETPATRAIPERKTDYAELYQPFPAEKTVEQAARCMDCGVPFCHSGCPLGNIIPEFNEAVHDGDWKEAYEILTATNNFPEFTGRICPAPCESACVLGINQAPVAIEHIEKSIAEEAFARGYARPRPPAFRTGKRVAVVGSGPAGLAAAAQLNQAGHVVTVYERDDRIGGLLRYGIPDFKLAKTVVERRVELLRAEGIRFEVNTEIGVDLPASDLVSRHDAVVLAGGSTVPRDIPQTGRELQGIHYAMDFLKQNNRRVAGDDLGQLAEVMASGKHVVVIGGGDTGADCVGTSNRHGAASVTQIELLGKPPTDRDPHNWPNWPMVLRTSTSHEEGADRQWALLTEEFVGDEAGHIRAIRTVEIEWRRDATGRHTFVKRPGSEREWPCDLLLIAAGFIHPRHEGMLTELGLGLDQRRNVATHDYSTNVPKVFAAGDMRRGQSLVVWAIAEGRECARAVDRFLSEDGTTSLPGRDEDTLLVSEQLG